MATWRDYGWALFAGVAAVLAVAWASATLVLLLAQGELDSTRRLMALLGLTGMELAIGAMVAIAAWHRTVWGCTLNHDGAEGTCQRHRAR